MDKAKKLSDEELLYSYYSYDALHYFIESLKYFYDGYGDISIGKDPLREKKLSLLRFEMIAKFCHYAEILGAFYLGYDNNEYSSDIEASLLLSTISNYKISEVDKLYQRLSNSSNNQLSIDDEVSLTKVFGYTLVKNRIKHNLGDSLSNIMKLLIEIGDTYVFIRNPIMHINMVIDCGLVKIM